jgi:hypothetical protein
MMLRHKVRTALPHSGRLSIPSTAVAPFKEVKSLTARRIVLLYGVLADARLLDEPVWLRLAHAGI